MAEDALEYSWQASEYVHHDKSAAWYVGLFTLAVVAGAAFGYFQQWFSVAVVVAMVLAIAVYSRKQPRVLGYKLDEEGITIENRLIPYDQLRTYSVHPDLGWQTIDLEPAKRFTPRLTLICEDANLGPIEEILASHLPRQDRDHDVIERLSRRLKF